MFAIVIGSDLLRLVSCARDEDANEAAITILPKMKKKKNEPRETARPFGTLLSSCFDVHPFFLFPSIGDRNVEHIKKTTTIQRKFHVPKDTWLHQKLRLLSFLRPTCALHRSTVRRPQPSFPSLPSTYERKRRHAFEARISSLGKQKKVSKRIREESGRARSLPSLMEDRKRGRLRAFRWPTTM